MCWSEGHTFDAEPSTPAAARRFAINQVHQALGDNPKLKLVLDDVVLVVSELATNAINAHASAVTIDIAIHRDYVRLAISDDAPGQPALQNPSPDATGGRGLRIVEQLARSWGIESSGDRKQTWAELSLDPASTVALRCAI